MKICFGLSLFVSLCYLLFKSKKAMHMMQQNYYNDDNRYLKWLSNNLYKSFIGFDMLFVIFLVLFFIKNSKLSLIVYVLLYIISYVIYKNKLKSE